MFLLVLASIDKIQLKTFLQQKSEEHRAQETGRAEMEILEESGH